MRRYRLSQVLSLPLVLIGSLFVQAQQPATPPADAGVSTLTIPGSALELSKPVADLKPEQISNFQHRLADWPGLDHYRDDNAKLGAPGPGQQRVVFYGDSITDIWGRGRGKFFPDMPWVNRGISGQTTPQMLVRFRQDVLDLEPQAVVILAGINDIAGNTGPETPGTIENNFRSMVALAKAEHVRVLLCSILPADHISWHPGIDPHQEVALLNQWLQSFAAQQHVGYLDYYSAMTNGNGGMKPGLSSDGVHPTDAGYAIMEPLARNAVTKLLAQPRP